MPKDEYPVAIPSVSYGQMAVHWDLIHDLLGGTVAMRKAGDKWLPKEPAESYEKYQARLGRAILYNGYEDTLNKLSSRPFAHPISVTDLPEKLDYLLEDVDSADTSLESLAEDLLFDLAKYGITHIFVDHTEVPQVKEGGATIADEKEVGARVLMSKISPADLIGWQVDKNGQLKQIRIREAEVEQKGDYGDEQKEYIRVWNANGTWERWVKNEKNQWEISDGGTHTFKGVPLITIYANREGYMTAKPPLENLAWLNLAHWQSYSDQRNILRLSRFGILFGKGFDEEYSEGSKKLAIGPSSAFLMSSETADLKYVEHNGHGIEAGAKDVADIEVKMELLGQQPLMRSVPNSTATAKRIDENRNISQLQAWIRAEEAGLIAAILIACKWRVITPKETLTVDIYSDFEATMSGATDEKHLLDMRKAGELSRVTHLKEVKRRGLLADSVSPEEEAQRIEDEPDEINELLNGLEDKDIPPEDGE